MGRTATAREGDRTPEDLCDDAMARLRRRRRRLSFLARAAAATMPCLAAAMLTVGCKAEYPVFDPHAIQRPEREAASTYRNYQMPPLPTTLQSTFLPARNGRTTTQPATVPTTGPNITIDPIVRLPLQEIIHRAVANNLDVRVAGYQPAIDATRAIEAEARFDPTYFANVQFERRDNKQAFSTVTSANNQDRENILTGQTGLRQNLESGGQVELRYQTSRTDVQGLSGFNASQVNPNPFWENQIVLQLTQPLLQNFGNEINRARIVISKNNQKISLLDFKKQIEETTRDTEQAYWQLVQAERDLRVAEGLLADTLRTADILSKRMGQDVTRVQLSQANASVEQRRTALVRARSRVRDLSDQLKRFMEDPDLPVTSNVLILPADGPLEEPVHFDLSDEMSVALLNRFELGQQQLRILNADIASNVAKNNLLPQLNFVGQIGFQGLGDGFESAFYDQMDFNNLNYQAGLQFEIPIGNRAARAVMQRARLQQQQAIDQYRVQVDQIALEVKTALREVETTWNEMAGRRQARFGFADQLSAIEQREAGGEQLTPTFVNLKLQSQSDLADAYRLENEAVANYNIAVMRLEFAKGTLLKYNNVIMEEEKLQLAGQ
jgi:outer membrane protein TolC